MTVFLHRQCPPVPATLLLAFASLLPGCADGGEDSGSRAAMDTLRSFQRALQQRDEATCRELLTAESRPLLAEMPWAEVTARQPLRVVDASLRRNRGHEFLVDVIDPNEGDAHSQFVVVREFGRLVVDLVATAGLHTVVTAATGEPKFEPRALTPEDHDRIREYQLAQPPSDSRGN
ncbi:MAG TPA: hypothetical protein ENI87_13835 [bacterium]|nr:hypothetical protein [bacterium]